LGSRSQGRPERMKRLVRVSPSAGTLGLTFPSIPLWEELSVEDGHERGAAACSTPNPV